MNIFKFVKFKSPYSKADEKTEKIMFKFSFFLLNSYRSFYLSILWKDLLFKIQNQININRACISVSDANIV